MIKTQVQIPDALFKRAKELATAKEWSFAEVVRRGLEHMTATNPPQRRAGRKWSLPPPRRLGAFLAPEQDWTALSHED